ncbi:MAG: BrnA antitoxin family protein [Silvibacterium sp.]|nr:BrnA antitoxin family protein [Silvibacterium sp.]MBV8437811.1 BrnA antitoxin family protein [Silvibacterium sp.]
MADRKPLTDDEGEVRELTDEDFAHGIPFSALPLREQEVLRSLKKLRGTQKSPTKQRISIRLSPEVVSKFRATGKGWQSRIDEALREWLKRHSHKLSA